ncbi:hypothetical protein M422DRAFT_776881 [Sphaerobolus stellatus SS14]|nr:hypothetical protein M422DRAFT_776881 [Sphaerobolus stellatus SS14]
MSNHDGFPRARQEDFYKKLGMAMIAVFSGLKFYNDLRRRNIGNKRIEAQLIEAKQDLEQAQISLHLDSGKNHRIQHNIQSVRDTLARQPGDDYTSHIIESLATNLEEALRALQSIGCFNGAMHYNTY